MNRIPSFSLKSVWLLAVILLTGCQLTITGSGTGDGSVTVSGGGLTCTITAGVAGQNCVQEIANDSQVTLTASAASGSQFDGWSGACDQIAGAICTVTMSANKTVNAAFSQMGGFRIQLGGVSGHAIPINASGTPAPTFKAFSVHVALQASGGVNLTSVTGSSQGSVLTGDLSCGGPVVPSGLPNDRVYACTMLGDVNGVSAGGLLGTLTLNGTGNGCVNVSLVRVPGDRLLDTFLIDADNEALNVSVDTATKRQVLFGSGSIGNCP